MISILHPSRQRPEKSQTTIQRWRQRAYATDYQIIVSLDDDDPTIERYQNLHDPEVVIIINKNRSAVDAINAAANVAMGDILVVVSDDTDCPIAWDDKIIQACKGREDFVLKVNDGIQPWIITMPIMDRKYYERFGYVYFPEYLHCFCDTEFTHVADISNRVIWRNDIMFTHLHYCVGKNKKDQINERADSTWSHGKSLYLKRFRENFGLPRKINTWAISNDQHTQWLKNALKG